jgi:hypothetical protein
MSHPRLQGADSPRHPALDESSWLSVHLYYHGDLDRLLVDVVHPLVTEFADRGLAEEWFFVRYWEGGKHLRLRVRPLRPGGRGELADLISAHGVRFFDRYPSVDVMRQEDYTRVARRLAAGEQRPSYVEQLHANNSVDFVPYRRELDRYGDENSMCEIERHFCESSVLVLSLVRAGASAGHKATAGYAAILLSWFCAEPDPDVLTGWTSGLFASWERATIAAGSDVDSAQFDERYQRQRASLLTTAHRLAVLSDRLAQSAPNGNLTEWATSIARLRDSLVALISEGRSALPDRGWAMGEPSSMRTRILPVLDICAHLFCNRLGISASEERYLRYLAGRVLVELAEEPS